MSVTKRGKTYHIRFRPFGQAVIGLGTRARSKSQAKEIEMAILVACRSGDYSSLNSLAREACIRLFQNQKWELPPELSGVSQPKEELTLWKALDLFLNYPEIRQSVTRERYEYALVHIVEKIGREKPIKSIWVPELKDYRDERQKEGASNATINRELSTLSKLFGVLIELRLVENNPVRLIEKLSEKLGERQVYLSLHDVHLIADSCPEWYQLVIWTAYYTGMRPGEMFGLTRRQVNLKNRMIYLGPKDVKEEDWKRVPVHHELVPYLKEALRLSSINSDKVFLVRDGKGIRELGTDTSKNPWPRACTSLEDTGLLKKPFPRFYDLRHTWKTNARRSRIDFEIRESIMGHWFREKSVSERYGRISNEELLQAIDSMTFDHGETEILVASWKDEGQAEKTCTKSVQDDRQKKRSCSNMTPNQLKLLVGGRGFEPPTPAV
ncbi:MAG: tyrosine-type recombinase/integrase [Desulfomonilaceae bacterium]